MQGWVQYGIWSWTAVALGHPEIEHENEEVSKWRHESLG
jgi:hypothetical protein